MKSYICASLILCAGVLPVSSAFAATPSTVAENARTVAGGRSVEVTVGQAEMNSDINEIYAPAVGTGLLGALIVSAVESKMNADRAKKAEAAITPVRDALTDFDADALALSTTKNAISTVDWLNTDTVAFSKDSTPIGESGFLDTGDAAQAAFFNYSYELSPDFANVRLVVVIQFANKASVGNKPEARLNANKLAYSQSITTVVHLPGAGTDVTANAQAWAADKGKLARSALTAAFAGAERLIPRTLALSDADVKAMNGKDKTRQTLNGYFGRTQESDANHTLLWNGSFVESEALPPTDSGMVEPASVAPEAQAPAQPETQTDAPADAPAAQPSTPGATDPQPQTPPAPEAPAQLQATPAAQ